MSGPENTFISSVHRHLPPESELYRLKNHNQYNAGIADCWYSGWKDLWIEWKFIVVPKRDDTIIDIHAGKKPSMTVLQRAWLRGRYDEGRNVWVGIGSKDGGVIMQLPQWWEHSFSAGWFRTELETRKELGTRIAQFVQGK